MESAFRGIREKPGAGPPRPILRRSTSAVRVAQVLFVRHKCCLLFSSQGSFAAERSCPLVAAAGRGAPSSGSPVVLRETQLALAGILDTVLRPGLGPQP